MRTAAILIALTIAPTHGAEPEARDRDALTQAVSLAFTGTVGTPVTVVDRTRCVFQIGSRDMFTVYFLNNVQFNRTSVTPLFSASGIELAGYTRLDLHGIKPVAEIHSPGRAGDSSVATTGLQKASPDHSPQALTVSDIVVTYRGANSQQVFNALQYIYAHGCQPDGNLS